MFFLNLDASKETYLKLTNFKTPNIEKK